MHRTRSDVALAILLLATPWVTTLVAVTELRGWVGALYLFGILFFAVAYALVVVIVVRGFLRPRPAFRFSGDRRPWVVGAAVVHPVGFLLGTLFVNDFGDSGAIGTPISGLLGLRLTPLDFVLSDVAMVLDALSFVALLLLVVEWARAERARRKVLPA